MNKKGIFAFLAITFGITYLFEIGMILMGVRFTVFDTPFWAQLIVAGLMWVPSLATFITVRFITHEKFSTTGLRIGSWKPYLVMALVVPVTFIVIYGLTWAFGLSQPDWQIRSLWQLMETSGADMSTAPDPSTVVVLLFAASLFVAPWINSLFALGEEWGWRGYLLPRLMPLGKWKAYLLVGLIWGLWHAPLILVGFDYPGYSPLLGLPLFIAITTILGLTMNELALRYRSAILAGWIHGLFNSQAYGIWRLVFTYNPLLGGFTGLIGLSVLALLGLITLRMVSRQPVVDMAPAGI